MDRWLPLGKGVHVCVSDVHRFGTDAILLADFARPHTQDTACDLGTGCGIIPLLWCRSTAPQHMTAVDLQPDAVDLLARAVEKNGLQARVSPLCADLRDLPTSMYGRFRLVTMNPPYQPMQTGALSPTPGRRLARQELTCTLADAAQAAAHLLQTGGRFCLCLRPERLTDALVALRQADLEPKRLRFVAPRPDVAPHLFLLEGKKGARAGLHMEPSLMLTDASGADSAEMKTILRDYREEKEADE